MPGNASAPRAAFLSRFDARPYSNTLVMTFSATGVTLATFGDGEGVFETPLHFLNGYGSRAVATAQTLNALTTAAYTGGGTPLWGVDSSDQIYFETSGGAATDFTITASTNLAAFGAAAATYGLVGGATPFRRTFENDWVRGNAKKVSITIDPVGAGAAFTVSARFLQNPMTWLRSQNEGDAETDSVTNAANLERTIGTALGLPQVRCGITTAGADDGGTEIKAGRVFFLLYGGTPAPTWNSTSFRDRLGFSGNEALRTVGGESMLIADYPMPGVWVPMRPLRKLEPWHSEHTAAIDAGNGDVFSSAISESNGWFVDAWAGGQSSSQDDEMHLMRNYWRYAKIGRWLTVYPHWGETRRLLHPYQVTSTQPAYSVLYTSEKRRGRLRCKRDARDQSHRQFEHEHDVLLRAPVQMILRDRID